MMKLLIAEPSPFARKVRVALHEKGIEFEQVLDNPWNLDARTGQINPLGKLPVLDTGDGRQIYDSRVIIEYLETLGWAPALLGQDAGARVMHRQIEALADGVCDAVVLIVLERARLVALRSTDWLERQQHKVTAGIAEAARLLDGREWYVGEAFGLADLSVGCMLGYVDLRVPEIEWRRAYPDLDALARRLESRPSFRRSRPESQSITEVR